VKLKSTLAPPSCLSTCNPAYPLQASDVKSGHCYIDRHCYAHGTSSPYSGFECTRCDAAVGPLQWSSPDTSKACFINGACVSSGAHAQVSSGRSYVDDPCLHCDPSVTSSDYSPVTGCKLPSTFRAGCYADSGSEVISLAAMMAENDTNHMTIASMQTGNAQLISEVALFSKQKTILETQLDSAISAGEAKSTATTSCEGMSNDLAIALIAVVSAMFVTTSAILGFLVFKERKGNPLFGPAPGVAVGMPVDGPTFGNPAEKGDV